MVIWITGLSGVGKTTLCNALYSSLKKQFLSVVKLDGDEIRKTISMDLGYQERDRTVQIQRIQRLANLLSEQGIIVLVAALYAQDDLLKWNRDNIQHYYEIYLKAPLSFLKKRDSKGVYSNNGNTSVVGVDIDWHEPKSADLTIDATCEKDPLVLTQEIIAKIPFFATYRRLAVIC